jgi:hypothetical protein
MRRLPFPLFLAGQVLLSGCSHEVEGYYRRCSPVPAVICALLVSVQSGGSPSFPPLCPGGCIRSRPSSRIARHARQKAASSALRLLAIPGQIGLEGGEALL